LRYIVTPCLPNRTHLKGRDNEGGS
jgi:hypothetical protein